MRTASWSYLGALLGVTALLAADTSGVGSTAPGAASFSAAGFRDGGLRETAFREANWPFLMDQWGIGRAFTCGALDCGAEIHVYLRAKIGFCNCATGVADDDEIDRVADLDLFALRYAPLAVGRDVTVGWMKGRARQYRVAAAPQLPVLAVAFADRCDVIVATAVAGDDITSTSEAAVMAFLNSQKALHWAKAKLGL